MAASRGSRLAEAALPLVALIRAFRPHVVTTYDENGGYPHPDHIMCHQVSVAAFDAAADESAYPEQGEPWQPLKLYYHHGFHKERFEALHAGMLDAGLESPFSTWLEEWVDRPEDEGRITTRVPCGDFFPVRDDALRAHATQIDDEGWWFGVPLEVQQVGVADRGVRAGAMSGRRARCRRTTCSPGSADRQAQWRHDDRRSIRDCGPAPPGPAP